MFPHIAVGDTKYGTVANIVGLEQDGIRAYIPTFDFSRRNEVYPPERFQYDVQRDLYVHPQGQELPLKVRRKSEQMSLYIAEADTCNACPLKPECTKSKSGRHIFRSFFHEYLDRATRSRETDAYKKRSTSANYGLNRCLEKVNNGMTGAVFSSGDWRKSILKG